MNEIDMLSIIQKIYENPHSLERREMHSIYAVYFGVLQVPSALPQAKEIAALAWKAQTTLYNSGYKKDLGWCDIGSNGIEIMCRAEVAHEANIYIQGIYDEFLLLEKYKTLCKEDYVCIDVGANVGIHSIAMAKIAKKGHVYAIEPRAKLAEQIYLNSSHNCTSNILVHQCAAYKENCEVSFSPNEDCYNQGVGVIDLQSSNKVLGRTLDSIAEDFTGQISLIKVDVEGAEMDVLSGAKKIIQESRPSVVIEYAFPPWTISNLKSMFPYPVKITRIQNTRYDSEFEVTEDTKLDGFNNLLVEEKK